MKLVTFSTNGTTHPGLLRPDDTIVDLSAVAPDIISFLAAGEAARTQAQTASGTSYKLADVKLHAPIPNPGKIICIGLNYRDHAAETGADIPDFPVVFAKYGNTVIGNGDAIILPHVTQQVDYEAELGVVIGRTARYVSEADALDYVAGYLPINDVSARDYQKRTSQWTMGKTFDTFAPMGPALVTADEIPDPHALTIQLTIDGEMLQNSNTSNLIFGIPTLIASLSEVMTLEPGDVISTGTPPGVGMARKPQRWLKPNDTVSITIQGLGTLTNPVKAES